MIKAINTQQGIIVGVPKEWIRPGAKEKSYNYHREKDSVHFADGWGEVIEVAVNPDIEKKGEVYQIADSKNFTYRLIPLSPEELEVKESQRMQSKIDMAVQERMETIQKEIEKQVIASFETITDEAELLEKKGIFPIWEKQEDEFLFVALKKYQAYTGEELGLFECTGNHLKDVHPMKSEYFTQIKLEAK